MMHGLDADNARWLLVEERRFSWLRDYFPSASRPCTWSVAPRSLLPAKRGTPSNSSQLQQLDAELND
jgi:hypothetical protein